MVADQTDDPAVFASGRRPSRALVRLLSNYGGKVARVRAAEAHYHTVMNVESRPAAASPGTSSAKRASARKVNDAFDALAEAVVELKGGRMAVLAQADADGVSLEELCVADERFGFAESRFSAYLAARNYDHLRAALDAASDS
jgi:hypothetical protein